MSKSFYPPDFRHRTVVDLSYVSVDELRCEIVRVESKTLGLRLIVVLNYKHDLKETEIDEH